MRHLPETVRRSELAGWANYGYCAAHSRWYWGLKLYLLTTAEGLPVTWCLADLRSANATWLPICWATPATSGRCATR